MSPIVHIHGFWKCESHLFVLNSNVNDIQKVQISYDPFSYVIDQLIKIMELNSITRLAHLYRKHYLDNRTAFVFYSTTQSFSCQNKI